MRFFFTLLTAVMLSVPALADLVMVQDMDGMGQKMTLTMKIKGDLTRIDVSPQMSMILNAKTGEMLSLMHEQKMYMKMNVDSMKGMMAQMTQANPAATAKPEIKASGLKEKINGYDTEEYIVTKGNTVSHLWLAKDFPNYQAVLKATESMRDGPLGKMSPQMQIDMSQLPGMPIKTVVEMDGKPTATVVLQSVTEKELDPAEFTAPADYKTIEMPAMPAMPAVPSTAGTEK